MFEVQIGNQQSYIRFVLDFQRAQRFPTLLTVSHRNLHTDDAFKTPLLRLPETSLSSTLFFNVYLSQLSSYSLSSPAENISELTCDSDVAKQNNVLRKTHQTC